MADLKPFTPDLEVTAAMRVASALVIFSMVSGGTVLQRGSPSPYFFTDFSHMAHPRSARTKSMGSSMASSTSMAASIMSKPESSPAM